MSRGSISHSYGYIPTYSNAMQQISPEYVPILTAIIIKHKLTLLYSRYMLKIRQQPIQARLSTNNERGTTLMMNTHSFCDEY